MLRRFSRVQAHAPLHVQSNMPGKLMLLYALQRVSTRPDVLPWLIIALSNLGAILLYLFVRDLFDDSRPALYAAVLYLFVPARHFFFPLMNTVTPIFVLACGWLLVRWLKTGWTAYAALMGLGLYGLVFFEPLPLVMGLLFLALVLAAIGRGEVAWDRFIGQTAVLIFVFIGTSETVAALSGFDAVRTFRSIGTHAVEFNESAGRPYWVWVRANLWEFVFGIGFCQATSFCVLLWSSLQGTGRWRERVTRPITALCLGLLAVLIAVDVIGVNRGEVMRLWIFLACFFQIPAAYVCSTLDGRVALPRRRGHDGSAGRDRRRHASLRDPMTSGRWLAAIVVLGAALRFVPIWFGLPYAQARPDETVALGLATVGAGRRLQPAFFPLALSDDLYLRRATSRCRPRSVARLTSIPD